MQQDIKWLIKIGKFRECLKRIENLPFESLENSILKAECLMGLELYSQAISEWEIIKEKYQNYPIEVDLRLSKAYLEIFFPEEADRLLRSYLGRVGKSELGEAFLRDCIDFKKSLFSIDVEQLESPYLFHFDQLPGGATLDSISKYVFAGWVGVPVGDESKVIVERRDSTLETYEFNVNRPDVVDYFKEKEVQVRGDVGFKYEFDFRDVKKFGVINNEYIAWICKFRIKKQLKVILGKDEWLFLGNDSNRSVDQYVGNFKLDADVIKRWREFLNLISDKFIKYKSLFVIPPSKESVFPEFYPFSRGDNRPVDVILSVMSSMGFDYLYPSQLLAIEKSAFPKNDTHWSDYGAALCVDEILNYFALENFVRNLKYVDRELPGDLGSKLNPPKISSIKLLDNRPSGKLVYKNQFVNHGAAIIFSNPEAPLQNDLIIFGDSFGIGLYKIFSFHFRNVIYVYSPASPVLEIVERFRDPIILLEINERFLVNPPKYFDTIDQWNGFLRAIKGDESVNWELRFD